MGPGTTRRSSTSRIDAEVAEAPGFAAPMIFMEVGPRDLVVDSNLLSAQLSELMFQLIDGALIANCAAKARI